MPYGKRHINLYLDATHSAMLADLSGHLDTLETKVVYRLIEVFHAKLTAYLQAKPLPADHRLEISRRGELEAFGPLPLTKENALRRVRHIHGAVLLDDSATNQLGLLAQRAGKNKHEILAEVIDYITRLASMRARDDLPGPPLPPV